MSRVKKMGYILLIFSALLLSFNFAVTKFYQKRYGNTLKTGLIFNIISGIVVAFVFSPFVRISHFGEWFSPAMVVIQTVFVVVYTLIGFKLMSRGTVALYTMSLMSGGMLVPYFFGIAFLNERVNVINVIGVILILAAVILMNAGQENLNKTNIFLLVCVFLINGGTSIVTKIHQISPLATFETLEFIWLSGVSRAVLSAVILPFTKSEVALSKQAQKISLKTVLIFILPIVLSVGLDKLAMGLQLIGAKTAPATMMFPIISGGTVAFTAIVSFLIYKEKLSKKSVFAIITCLIGTFLFV